MVEFLETTGVSHELTKLIKSSEEKLWLISPYLQIANNLRNYIRERDNRRIDILFVFRRSEQIKEDELLFLQELVRKSILSCENLHAKCYLNENTAIITSMNLYQYSQQNNREMGIKVDKEHDPELYQEIFNEAKSIIESSEPYRFKLVQVDKSPEEESKPIGKEIGKNTPSSISKSPAKQSPTHKGGSPEVGHCIRCGEKMQFSPDKPLCDKCYPIWAKFKDGKYPEKYCHVCGKESKQSYEKPICYSCWKKIYK